MFNKYQQDRGKTKYPIRHSVLTDDNYVLKKLQERNWSCFINRTIEFSQGFINLADETDQTEINILTRSRSNFEIVKNLYHERFNSVGINLHDYFRNLGIVEKQRIDADLRNHNYFTWDPKEQFIQQRILTTYRDFFYETGRFPGRNTIIPVRRAQIHNFINSDDVLSPRALYEA